MSNLMLKNHNEKIIVAFDVDDTLIDHNNLPRYDIVQVFHFFKKCGCEMVIWSQCGEEYARKWAKFLGLDARIIPKSSIRPHLTFDDAETANGLVSIKV